MCLILIGFILFGLGYALFSPNPEADFSSAGLSNRIVIASALGPACVLIGAAGLGCSLLSSEIARLGAFAVALGIICAAYCLTVSGIGFFGTDANSQQLVISKILTTNLQSIPKNSVVLLDGICRYSGPAVVFETDWDTSGALQLATGDASLRGNVVSPDLTFGETVVDPIGKTGKYRYGPNLFVYNLRQNTVTALSSESAALAYLSRANPAQDSGCPLGRHEHGVKVF